MHNDISLSGGDRMTLIITEKTDILKVVVAALERITKCSSVRKTVGKEGYGKKKFPFGYTEIGKYFVTAASGHILELKPPEAYDSALKKWNLDTLPIYFENWENVPKEAFAGRVKMMGSLLKKVDTVVNAGDPDDEGQYLVDEILEYFSFQGKVMRIDTSSMEISDFEKKLRNPDDNAKWAPQGDAARARSISDFVVGINYSRLFTVMHQNELRGDNGKNKVFKIGRVKTPTLNLVVTRDLAIENFTVRKHFGLKMAAFKQSDGPSFPVAFSPAKDNPILEDGYVMNQSDMLRTGRVLDGKECPGTISKKKKSAAAPLPFTGAVLQSHCYKKYGIPLKKTIEAADALRLKHHLITYARTDCPYLREEHFVDAPNVVPSVLQNLGLDPGKTRIDLKRKSKCFNDKKVTVHFGIIPTKSKANIDKLTDIEKKVYTEVAHRYIALFMEDCKKETTSAVIPIKGDNCMKASSTQTLVAGWTALLSRDDDKDSPLSELSGIKSGKHQFLLSLPEIVEKTTRPPARYTPASLLDDMSSIARFMKDPELKRVLIERDKDNPEAHGSIGTVATREETISELIKSEMLELKGGKIISTAFGRRLIEVAPTEIKRLETTAEWYLTQEGIRDGSARPEVLIQSVLNMTTQRIEQERR